MGTFSLSWLSDPEIFAVNRLPAVSDHAFYANMDEADARLSSLVRVLDGEWRVHLAMRPSDAPDSLLTDGSGDDNLLPFTVPGEFQLAYPDWDPPHYVNTMYPWDGHEALQAPQVSEIYNPTVTAVRHFHLSDRDLADCPRAVLTFCGVEAAVAVYMNGSFVGYAEDSFTPHRFDVRPLLVAGENRLVARVFKRCTGSWVEDQDFWRFSGIHRSVTLTLERRSHLEDVFVHTPLTEDLSQARVTAELKILRPEGRVRGVLTAPDGTVAGEAEAQAGEQVTLDFPLEHPALWSAEQPSLYTLTVTLGDDPAIEVSRLQVGVRRFEMKNGVMCLNGKRIVFHGVNRHEFCCDHGRVMTSALLQQDIREMKSMNVNAVRTCHYPNTSEFYALCDRYGLYVIDETNIESHGSWSPYHDWVVPGDRPEWREVTLDRGRSMQERDKNHPCILLWSCGNESFGGSNLHDLHDMFRARDDSRLVHYEGVRHDPRYPDTTDVHSRMYAKVADIEEYLQGTPDKPFINCEYTHAMGNSCGGIELYRELEDKYPLYQGGFIWDYIDQALRTTGPNGETRLSYGGDWGDRPTDYNFNTNGIILGDRTLTPKVQEVRHAFRYAEMVVTAEKLKIRNTYLFSTLDRFELRWEVLSDGECVDQGRMDMPVVAAGQTVEVSAPWTHLPDRGETAIVCRLALKAPDGLMPRGTVLAEEYAVLGSYRAPAALKVGATAVVCDSNIGLDLSGSTLAMCSRKYGGLISLKDAAGRETLLRAPLLSLFRAATDNDRGNRNDVAQGLWMAVSRANRMEDPEVAVTENGTLMTYRVDSPLLTGNGMTVSYLFDGSASVTVTVDFAGMENAPDLPALGLSFQLDRRLDNVEYYGMGPDEAYADRCRGAMPGIWNYRVEDGWTRYAIPQESGSRMGVRSMKVTDDDGHGVLVETLEAPLEISVQPWLPEELNAAYHPDELVGSCRTVLDVAMFRKGIGGDDSWGAPVLPQYVYPSDRHYHFSFRLTGI